MEELDVEICVRIIKTLWKKLSQNWAAIQLFEKEILPPKQNKLKFVQLDYSAYNMWISQIKPSIHILFTS